jgi:hypothetical protein
VEPPHFRRRCIIDTRCHSEPSWLPRFHTRINPQKSKIIHGYKLEYDLRCHTRNMKVTADETRSNRYLYNKVLDADRCN